MKNKIIFLLFICLFIVGCSNSNLNKRISFDFSDYENVKHVSYVVEDVHISIPTDLIIEILISDEDYLSLTKEEAEYIGKELIQYYYNTQANKQVTENIVVRIWAVSRDFNIHYSKARAIVEYDVKNKRIETEMYNFDY